MKYQIFLISLLFIFLNSCVPEEPDTLGDILVRVTLTGDSNPNLALEAGVFPLEALSNDEFTPDLAIKSAMLRDDRAVITNILPGIYVVAFLNETGNNPAARQVVQIVADEVTIVDFDLDTLND